MDRRTILYCIVFLIVVTINIPSLSNQEKKEVIRNKIEILSDEDFSKYQFSGNGSKNNPYLIENLFISYFSDLIHIKNTTKYFIIRNNILTSGKKAIFIEEIADNTGKILNNSIQECESIAIDVEKSNGIQIENNYIYYCLLGIKIFEVENCLIKDNKVFSSFSGFYEGGTGLYLYNCKNITIANNDLKGNADFGLVISTSFFVKTVSNEITNNVQGIFISSSSFLTFEENNCSLSAYGIFVDKSFEIKIKENFYLSNENFAVFSLNSHKIIISKNTIKKGQIGLFFKDSININITGNSILKTSKLGIQLLSSEKFRIIDNIVKRNYIGITANSTKNIEISKNSFVLNDNYAIFLNEDSTNFIIYWNDFINNNLDGKSQAYDDGKENKWYNEEMKSGNFWYPANSIGRNYKIDGNANSKDIYILNSVVYPENTDFMIRSTSKLSLSFLQIILTLIFLSKKIQKKKHRHHFSMYDFNFLFE